MITKEIKKKYKNPHIVLYSSIYIELLNSHWQTEAQYIMYTTDLKNRHKYLLKESIQSIKNLKKEYKEFKRYDTNNQEKGCKSNLKKEHKELKERKHRI